MPTDESAPEKFFGKLYSRFRRAIESEAYEDATDAVCDIFSRAMEWCENNPSPELDLTIAAAECEENADWRGAEANYLEILSLPDVEPCTEYKARSDLAGLCRLLNRDSDALEHARCATDAARRADLPILLALALQGEALCLIRCDCIDEAGEVLAESQAVLDEDDSYDHLRGSALTLCAACAIENGAIDIAGRYLEQAFRFLRPLAELDVAAGVHSNLAGWWAVTAKLRAAENDLDASVDAWREAVSISKHVASLPHAENVYSRSTVAAMLKRLAKALEDSGHSGEAYAVTDEREGILRSIRLPDDSVP